MRKIDVGGWMMTGSSRAIARTARLSAIALGIGLLLASGVARAQEDDQEDDKTFEEKIIDNVMRGMGATNMETPTINYRERSPLVVPPKLDLPPPASTQANAPNWPKDPDVLRREAEIAARKNEKKDPLAAAQPLTPAELKAHKTARAKATEPVQPGTNQNNPMLSPSQLGFKGGLLGMFKGGKDTESKQFTSEPERENLTQPPPGYQTPSPSYAYGTGPQEPLNAKHFDVLSGKEK
jgi:hypothetical protein